MHGLPPVHVEELHEDFYLGVDQALGRLAEAVGRSIERSRDRYAPATRRNAA
jgi:ribosome-associated translation inhibitor RaiA